MMFSLVSRKFLAMCNITLYSVVTQLKFIVFYEDKKSRIILIVLSVFLTKNNRYLLITFETTSKNFHNQTDAISMQAHARSNQNLL